MKKHRQIEDQLWNNIRSYLWNQSWVKLKFGKQNQIRSHRWGPLENELIARSLAQLASYRDMDYEET